MSEIQRNIETCRGEDVLAEIANHALVDEIDASVPVKQEQEGGEG